jgi:hypothetical protein
MLILEDLRMDYTPYYIHYYHLLKALHQDYSDKPKLIENITKKIEDKLHDKVKDLHEEIVKRYMIDSESTLHSWISHYLNDP